MSAFLCVYVCWIVAKMPMHSWQGLEKGDYTAIAPVNLGQCLPREVVATQVVHVADQAFTGAVQVSCGSALSCFLFALSARGLAAGSIISEFQ